MSLAVSPTIVGKGGFVSANGTTTIIGGPSPAAVDLVFTDKTGVATMMKFQTVMKRDGTWSLNVPVLPVHLITGTGTLKATVTAGGKTATDTVTMTGTGGDFDCSMSMGQRSWTYENDGVKTANRHTATFTVLPVPNTQPPYWYSNPTYQYEWKAVPHPRTGKGMTLVSGGGPNDSTATFAAPQAPAGHGDSYVVTCGVTITYHSQYQPTVVTATEMALSAAAVPVRLLGDANGDGKVTVTDFSIWKSQNGQTGLGLSADFNGDGQVTVTDFSLWKEHNGQAVP
jgi:hypothetical protein